MSRISQSSAALGLLAFASLTLGFGCHVIAGLEDREVTGGAGGASSSSSGEMTAVTSSSSGSSGMGGGGGMGPMSCEADPPPTPGCESTGCNDKGDATTGCHCGDCDIDCGNGMGGPCLPSGLCPSHLMKAVEIGKRIHRVAVHGGNIAYPIFDPLEATTKIQGLRLDGATLQPDIVAGIDGYVQALALDCGMVYFATTIAANSAGFGKGENALWVVPIAGNEAAKKFPMVSGGVGSQFETIVVDDRAVYWTDELGVGVWQKPLGPGMPNAPPPQRVPGHDGKSKAVGLAVRGNNVYWSTSKDDGTEAKIWSVSILNGVIGAVTQLGKTYPGKARQVAVDNTHVYWVDVSDSTQHRILKIARTSNDMMGAVPVFTFPTNVQLHDPIAVEDDSHVYVTTTNTGTAFVSTCRVGKDGQSAACQAHTGLDSNSNLGEQWFVRGGSRLYLATPKTDTNDAGQIYRITVGKSMP